MSIHAAPFSCTVNLHFVCDVCVTCMKWTIKPGWELQMCLFFRWKSSTSISFRGWTTACASGLSALVAAEKSVAITSVFATGDNHHLCKWNGCISWKKEITKCKMQGSGPPSALVDMDALQHATTTTITIDQIGPAEQQNASVSATCVRARFAGEKAGPNILSLPSIHRPGIQW